MGAKAVAPGCGCVVHCVGCVDGGPPIGSGWRCRCVVTLSIVTRDVSWMEDGAMAEFVFGGGSGGHAARCRGGHWPWRVAWLLRLEQMNGHDSVTMCLGSSR